eukprot:s1100_g2.t1
MVIFEPGPGNAVQRSPVLTCWRNRWICLPTHQAFYTEAPKNDVHRQVDTEKAKISKAQKDSLEAARQSLEDLQAEFDSLQAPDLSPQDDSVAAVLREVDASSKQEGEHPQLREVENPAPTDGVKHKKGNGCPGPVLANRLEPTRNLLLLNFDFAPLEVFLAVGLVPSILRRFVDAESDVQRLALKVTFSASRAEEVYAQIPDFLTVPAGDGAARFGLGHLHLTSTEPCTYERMDFDLDLKDTSLRRGAVSARGAQFHVAWVNPLHLNAHIQLQLLPDETLVDIKGRVSQVCLCLSPQALQILLGCRSALTSSAWLFASPQHGRMASPGQRESGRKFKVQFYSLQLPLADDFFVTTFWLKVT